MILPLPPTRRALLRIGFVFILALLGQEAAAQKVFYRVGGPVAPLQTARQIDSIMAVANARLAKGGFVLSKKIIRTTTRHDTTFHELVLSAANAGVVASRTRLATFVGKPLPAFALPDLAGKPVRSADLLGHPVVINMWFTTCAPCVAEMPALNKIQGEQAGSDVVFLALTYEERGKVLAFLPRHAFTFRHIPDAAAYCAQFTNTYPISIFVDRAGVVRRIEGGMGIVDNKLGAVNDNEFRAALELITRP